MELWSIHPASADALARLRNEAKAAGPRSPEPKISSLRQDDGAVARIRIEGPITRTRSIWSTVFGLPETPQDELLAAITSAAADPSIDTIALLIDSGGGIAQGSYAVYEAVRSARDAKHVVAVASGTMASAAMEIAAGAGMIYAEADTVVGSIGTYAYLDDSSESFRLLGVRRIMVTTAPAKGAGTPGVPVADEAVANLEQLVTDMNNLFLTALRDGRGLSAADVARIGTGEVWIAERAQSLRLVDAVASGDDVLSFVNGAAAAAEGLKMKMSEFLRNCELGGLSEAEGLAAWAVRQGREPELPRGGKHAASLPADAPGVDDLKSRTGRAVGTDVDFDFVAESRELAKAEKITIAAAMSKLAKADPQRHREWLDRSSSWTPASR